MLGLLGIAADYQFLFLNALRLEPQIRSSGTIGRFGTLRDDAFEGKSAGVTQHLIAWLGKMLAVKELVRRLGHNFVEQRLALGERSRAQIDAIEMQEIEGVVAQAIQLFRRQSVLQTVEGKGAVIRQVNHFAVDHGAGDLQFCEGGAKRLETFAPVIRGACKEFGLPVRHHG